MNKTTITETTVKLTNEEIRNAILNVVKDEYKELTITTDDIKLIGNNDTLECVITILNKGT